MSKKLPTVIRMMSKKLHHNSGLQGQAQRIEHLPYNYWPMGVKNELSQFIEEQMEEYPFSDSAWAHQESSGETSKEYKNAAVEENELKLASILLRLQRRISYEELEKLNYQISNMTNVEIKRNSKTLYLIASRVRSSIDNDDILDVHLIQQASDIVSRVTNSILHTKSHQLC